MVASIVMLAGALTFRASGPVDMRGAPVAVDGPAGSALAPTNEAPAPLEGSAPPQEGSPPPLAADPVTERFRVPSVDLDVKINAMEEEGGVIHPPGFTSVYWIQNFGVDLDSPASGTVYIATHSLRNGGLAPGNFLFDVETGRSRVPVNAAIYVGAVKYVVAEARTVKKDELPAQTDLWANTPNLLVVVTCLQTPSNQPSTHNFVLIARRT